VKTVKTLLGDTQGGVQIVDKWCSDCIHKLTSLQLISKMHKYTAAVYRQYVLFFNDLL
jgi:hypothetical protein